MTVELYRVEPGPKGLESFCWNGGWKDILDFEQKVHINEFWPYNDHVWWITHVDVFTHINKIPDDIIESRDNLSVCLVSPPKGTEQRYAVIVKIPAFSIGGFWYITEKNFDNALTSCFPNHIPKENEQ